MATTSDQQSSGFADVVAEFIGSDVRWVILDTACQAQLLALLDSESSGLS